MTLNVESPKVYTRHGVPISVTGIAQVGTIVITIANIQVLHRWLLLLYYYYHYYLGKE